MPTKRKPTRRTTSTDKKPQASRTNTDAREAVSGSRNNSKFSSDSLSTEKTRNRKRSVSSSARIPRELTKSSSISGGSSRKSRANSKNKCTSIQLESFNTQKSNSSSIAGALSSVGSSIAHLFLSLSSRTRIILIVILVLLFFFAVDTASYANKFYSGVKIGDVDVSGMSVDEARDALKLHYDDNLNNKTIYVFTDETSYNEVNLDDYFEQQDKIAEQITSLEQTNDAKILQTSAHEIGAHYNYDKAINDAFKVGHGLNIFERIGARLLKNVTPLNLKTGDGLEVFYSKVAESSGSPHVDYGIEVTNGNVNVTEGHDGEAVNRDYFLTSVVDSLKEQTKDPKKLLFSIEADPVKIDKGAAETVKSQVETAISEGAVFNYNNKDISISKEQMGDWVTTRIDKSKSAWKLIATVDDNKAMQSLSSFIADEYGRSKMALNIQKDDAGNIKINPVGDDPIPDLQQAVNVVKENYFSERVKRDKIQINDSTQRSDFDFQTALNLGLITKVSSFTTQFTNTSSTANRNHNIALVSETISNTIISKNNGEFSFNTASGPCDAEHGYLDAGTQVGGQIVQEAGGGICQVATTVFNAAYNAGLPITERHNHALRNLSYPDGLDAAVYVNEENHAWDNDLKWENDTDSDLLLVATHDDSSVTVTLYGVPNGRTIQSIPGEFTEGEKHKIIFENNASLAEGQWTVKTVGTDGTDVTVERKVYDANGNLLYDNYFSSSYSKQDEVIYVGPNADTEKIKELRGYTE